MICVDTTSVFGGIKTKSLELTFLIFKKSGVFLLKFNIVPTLCDKFSFNTYVGQTLQFNLMILAFMPGSAVFLFLSHFKTWFCGFLCLYLYHKDLSLFWISL